jgi:hypothetical protein
MGNRHIDKYSNSIRILLVFCTLFLVACGGGSGGGSNAGSGTNYRVIASAGASGTITPDSVTVSSGASTSFTLTPNSGFVIDTVTGCAGSLVSNAYTTAAVSADCTVSATFKLAVITSTDPTDARLSGLSISLGAINEAFDPDTTAYTATVGNLASSVKVKLNTANIIATIEVNGATVSQGSFSPPIALSVGANAINIVVNSESTLVSKIYTLEVVRLAVLSQRHYLKAQVGDTSNGQAKRTTFGSNVALSGNRLAVSNNSAKEGIEIFSRVDDIWQRETTISLFDHHQIAGSLVLDSDTLAIGGSAINSCSIIPFVICDRVIIFVRQGGQWVHQQSIVGENDGGHTGFSKQNDGWWGNQTPFGSKSMALDGNTLVIGAPAEDSAATGVDGDQRDNSLPDSGAVFVYHRSGGIWTLQAYLKASNPGSDGTSPLMGDGFGTSVSISGDTIVVGAPFEDTVHGGGDNGSGDQTGAVYVFTRINGQWSEQAYIKEPPPSVPLFFGSVVVVSGDTIAAYNSHDGPFAASFHSVRIYTRSNGNWSLSQTLNRTGGETLFFSRDILALDEDILAVSSPASIGRGGDDSGKVAIYTRANGSWSFNKVIAPADFKITPTRPRDQNDFFGTDVDISGDTIVVGSHNEDSSAIGVDGDQTDNSDRDSGAAYLFW